MCGLGSGCSERDATLHQVASLLNTYTGGEVILTLTLTLTLTVARALTLTPTLTLTLTPTLTPG